MDQLGSWFNKQLLPRIRRGYVVFFHNDESGFPAHNIRWAEPQAAEGASENARGLFALLRSLVLSLPVGTRFLLVQYSEAPRLMIEILHYLKDPKLWEFWYIPYYG